MTAPRDPDRLIGAFLDEGQVDLPDRTYDAVRAHITGTRQRVVIGPWREPRMSNMVRFSIAGAAVLLAAVVGFNVLPGGSQPGGPVAVATPTATPTTEPSPQPLPMNGSIDPGVYVGDMWVPTGDAVVAPPYTITVPGGWSAYQQAVSKEAGEPPTGAFIRIWLLDRVRLYDDPCDTSLGLGDPVAATVDELADALAGFEERVVAAPTEVAIGGHPGMVLELKVPEDIVFADCDGAQYRTWVQGSSDIRYHQGPGQRDRLWILDVDGQRVVIDAAYFPGTSDETVAELFAMVESIRFEGT